MGCLIREQPFSIYPEHSRYSSCLENVLAILTSRCHYREGMDSHDMWWVQELPSIKMNASLKCFRYGCTTHQMMCIIAVWLPSTTNSNVWRPHIMPPQNFREPPSCCSRWMECLKCSGWRGCLQKCIWQLSARRQLRVSSVNSTNESIRHAFGPICTALRGV